MFFPCTKISPDYIGYIPKSAFNIDVFPEPVLPQNAIFSPFFIEILTSFNANYIEEPREAMSY